MAKMIQIRHVPDAVHRELMTRAAREGLSLSDYLLHHLERIVEQRPMEEVMARARRRDTRVTTEDVVASIGVERSGR